MDKKEFLKKCLVDYSTIKLKLKMFSFLMKQGKRVDEDEMNALLDRLNTLKKLIEELQK